MKHNTIIERMSLTEKALMMSGESIWKTKSFPEYNIPSLFLADGPTGLRKQSGTGDHLGLNASVPATCFPTAATIANSWDEDLAEQLGQLLGEEALEQGVDVVLGPGLNIKRNPLCGRNFEYFSEDPILSGKMASSYVKGIQSKGVGACPKHFALNNQELRRMSNDSIVDERTMRELYLTGFEMVVKEAQPQVMMSAYNKINGTYANENKYLLRDILVDEWKFDGFVVSDWGGSNDHILGVENGSHLEMPSTGKAGAYEIVQAVKEGRLSEQVLDERVDELLSVIFKISETKKDRKIESDTQSRHDFARRAAQESIVLLKNEDRTLPLQNQTRVAIIGDFAQTPRYQGAGSSLVNPTQVEAVLSSLDAYNLNVAGYAQGYDRIGKFSPKLIEEAKSVAADSEVILLFIGLTEISEVEGLDRDHMKLPKNQELLLNELMKLGKKVVVVLSGGSAIELPWIHQVEAVVHTYLSGQAGATATLDVLTGKVNPSGKLNETYPIRYEDTSNYAYYPGMEQISEYREGLYVGYRYYDKVNTKIAFPFGHGLSYTSFTFNHIEVNETGVSFEIMNTGEYDGAEVVQLYIGKKESQLYRAKKELKGFKKIYLRKGEKTVAHIPFDEYSFRVFDAVSKKWVVEDGNYTIYVGTSSQDILFEQEIYQEGVILTGTLDKKRLVNYYNGTVTNISRDEFAYLYGQAIPESKWDKSKPLGINDTLSQMYYAKSALARGIYKLLTYIKDRSIKKGKPNLNILFNYNMPLRAIGKMTGGAINEVMVEGIVLICNGHFFKGLNLFRKGYALNRLIKKRDDLTTIERK